MEDDALDRLLATSGPPPALRDYGPDRDHVFEHYGEGGSRRLVLIHGGYFRPSIDRTHARPMARALADQGWEVILPEYRRVPGNPFATVSDLRDLDRDLGTVRPTVWVGHSAGGLLALWRAVVSGLAPLPTLALAPVAHLAIAARERLGAGAISDWMGGGPDEVPGRYAALNPGLRLPPAPAPLLLLHGADDQTVPPEQSTDSPWPASVLAGAHHYDLIDPDSRVWPQVLQALELLLP